MEKRENRIFAASLIILIFVLCGYLIYNIVAGINVIKTKNSATIVESQTSEKYALSQLINDPIKGIKSASITIFIFSNFEAKNTKDVLLILNNLLAKYPDKINIVWKDFWNSKNYFSPSAALSARCANEQGKYWEFADKLLDGSKNFDLIHYEQIASDLKMDADKFLSCYQSGKYVQDVQYNITEADVLKVDSAPTIFINQQKISGSIAQDNLENVIKALIK
jgi:protein-disulfide isomerase